MSEGMIVYLDCRLQLEHLGCPTPPEMAGDTMYRVSWVDDSGSSRQAFATAATATDAKRIVRALCGGLGQSTHPLPHYRARAAAETPE